MTRIIGLVVLGLCGVLPGCMKFPVVGSYYKQALMGTADYNPFSGTSYIQIDGKGQKVRCAGNTYGTYAPLFTLSGAGYGGEGELKCNDGKFFKVQWATLSWGTGYGVGRDQNGDRMTFVYGMDESEGQNFLLKELPAILQHTN